MKLSSVNNRIISGEMSGATRSAIKSLIERVRHQREASLGSADADAVHAGESGRAEMDGDLWVFSNSRNDGA